MSDGRTDGRRLFPYPHRISAGDNTLTSDNTKPGIEITLIKNVLVRFLTQASWSQPVLTNVCHISNLIFLEPTSTCTHVDMALVVPRLFEEKRGI
jgi:hypothetical protein